MQRTSMIRELEKEQVWDMVIIGGGATGLGAAVDAASRGYKTLLLEAVDFAKGTSSRSTKLVHGGVRYLQQGNIKLVMEALHERGLLLQNAPHLTRNQSFIVPNYKWWETPFYGVGLKVYDWMSGKLGLGPSQMLNTEEVLSYLPTLDPDGLRGGTIYHDGQFDDARLAINLAQTVVDEGGTVLNYCKVTGFLKKNGKLTGLQAIDELRGSEYEIQAKAVINATGIFVDDLLKMDKGSHEKILALSQGVHVVVDGSFMPGKNAIMVPKTDDGRVLFAVPWHNRIIVGTTDTAVEKALLEPVALESEVAFIMEHIARYLTHDPQYSDVKSIFAGLRPLVKPEKLASTASISREHSILVSDSGLVTITGGKWTTYRKMGMDVVNMAEITAGFQQAICRTEILGIHGATAHTDETDPLHFYGSDAEGIRERVSKNSALGESLHPDLPYSWGSVDWAVREEMAMTVDDVLSRRTRSLLLDARAAIQLAPSVAAFMASQMELPVEWEREQVDHFNVIARNYLPASG